MINFFAFALSQDFCIFSGASRTGMPCGAPPAHHSGFQVLTATCCFVFCSLIFCSGFLNSQSTTSHALSPDVQVSEIDLASSNNDQFSFLYSLPPETRIVALSESIHLTHEFPLLRLAVTRSLNENQGYDVIASEGSPVDLWVSQDRFLDNPTSLSTASSGLFGLWNTPEVRALFDYERNSWGTNHPLYATSFDIEPGSGKESHGQVVFALLRRRLTQYAKPPSALKPEAWEVTLAKLTGACQSYTPDDDTALALAIDQLDEWIKVVQPMVLRKFPSLPMHSSVLQLLPASLRASLSLCAALHTGSLIDWKRYKDTRDAYTLASALFLQSIAPNHRLILWGHTSHLAYGDSGTNPSLGDLLRTKQGSSFYTIGMLAAGGGTTVLFSDVSDDIGYSRISGVRLLLSSPPTTGCVSVCFIDLSHTRADSPFRRPIPVWIEAGRQQLALAKSFDGIFWIRSVSPPQMPLGLFIYLATKHYQPMLLRIAAVFLTLLLSAILARQWRRMRKL